MGHGCSNSAPTATKPNELSMTALAVVSPSPPNVAACVHARSSAAAGGREAATVADARGAGVLVAVADDDGDEVGSDLGEKGIEALGGGGDAPPGGEPHAARTTTAAAVAAQPRTPTSPLTARTLYSACFLL